MELVSDAAFGAESEHCVALVFECVWMLVASEFAPGGMELAGHAQVVMGECLDILCGECKVVVAPAARGQRFQLKVGEVVVEGGTVPRLYMAGVVEDRHLRINRKNRLRGHAVVSLKTLLRNLLEMFRIVGVKTLLLHDVDTVLAGAGPLADDVKEDAIAVGKLADDLLDLLAKVLDVGGVEANLVEPRVKVALGDGLHGLEIDGNRVPLGMLGRQGVVKTRGDVNRCVDVYFLACVKLSAQQVVVKVRMTVPNLGVVVVPAMVALRKQGDGVDMGGLQGRLPLLLVETLANARNLARCVKVQMNLAKTKMMGLRTK